MCLAIPMQVMEINGATAQVAQEGVTRAVRVDFLPDLAVGEYVLIHAGLAIERIDAVAAEETLKLIRELADEIPR